MYFKLNLMHVQLSANKNCPPKTVSKHVRKKLSAQKNVLKKLFANLKTVCKMICKKTIRKKTVRKSPQKNACTIARKKLSAEELSAKKTVHQKMSVKICQRKTCPQ